jgi:hypothetical protein
MLDWSREQVRTNKKTLSLQNLPKGEHLELVYCGTTVFGMANAKPKQTIITQIARYCSIFK